MHEQYSVLMLHVCKHLSAHCSFDNLEKLLFIINARLYVLRCNSWLRMYRAVGDLRGADRLHVGFGRNPTLTGVWG
jgi:hypothetical protein